MMDMPGGTRGTSDRGVAGTPGKSKELKRPGDNEGPGGRGGDMMTSGQGGARVPED